MNFKCDFFIICEVVCLASFHKKKEKNLQLVIGNNLTIVLKYRLISVAVVTNIILELAMYIFRCSLLSDNVLWEGKRLRYVTRCGASLSGFPFSHAYGRGSSSCPTLIHNASRKQLNLDQSKLSLLVGVPRRTRYMFIYVYNVLHFICDKTDT